MFTMGFVLLKNLFKKDFEEIIHIEFLIATDFKHSLTLNWYGSVVQI